jgi:hypothetical protein
MFTGFKNTNAQTRKSALNFAFYHGVDFDLNALNAARNIYMLFYLAQLH